MDSDNMIRIPQHRRLYEILRKHITDGLYPEGSLLPSENEMCAIHEVTRPTVRQALAQLAFDGYIVKHQGKGSIVKKLPKGIGILSLQGTTSSIGKENLETHLVSKPRINTWPERFMFNLTETEIESGCIILERQRIVNQKPLLYEISYLPNINLPRFNQRSFENKSLFDVLRKDYHISVLGGEQQIRAVRADLTIGRYLEINEGDPVLHLRRIMETNRIGFRYFSSIYCNTENTFLNGNF